jgi:alpha-maltose-1-phosphate synthase
LKSLANRRMRIACFSSDFTDYTNQLANALSENGAEVFLLLDDRHLEDYVDQADSMKCIKKRLYHQGSLYSPKNILLVFGVMKQLLVFNPDIIHFQAFQPWFLLIFPWLRLKGHHIVATFHDVKNHLGERRPLTTPPMSLTTNYLERIFVHGWRLKELLMTDYPANQICVIPIGEHNVAPLKKYSEGLIEERNSILYFGRIFQYKGLEYLIRAEPRITREIPDAKIVIAGRGDFVKYRELMVNPENFIVHNHFIGSRQAAELFAKCSLVVLPYVDASQSGVVPVAYAFKKPVVATNVGSLSEIVDDGKTGYVVRARDEVALAAAIVRLLRDDSLRRELGDNGYRKLKNELSWEKIAEKTIRVYWQVLRDGVSLEERCK